MAMLRLQPETLCPQCWSSAMAQSRGWVVWARLVRGWHTHFVNFPATGSTFCWSDVIVHFVSNIRLLQIKYSTTLHGPSHYELHRFKHLKRIFTDCTAVPLLFAELLVECKHLPSAALLCRAAALEYISRHHTNIQSPAECRRCCGEHTSAVSEQRIDTIDTRQRVILTGPRILMKPKAILL